MLYSFEVTGSGNVLLNFFILCAFQEFEVIFRSLTASANYCLIKIPSNIGINELRCTKK